MQPAADQKIDAYYDHIVSHFTGGKKEDKIAFIVVSHVLPDAPKFVSAIAKVGRIAAVVPKTSFRDSDAFDALAERFPVPFPKEFSSDGKPKDTMRAPPSNAIEFIKKQIKEDERVIILDHGGYFAPAYNLMQKDETLRQRIVGISEATENGHQKYEHALSQIRATSAIPVISRARSKLKAPEDHNVGTAIVHSTENILRNADGVRIEDRKDIGIFGFGKIGRSIAQRLQREGKHVRVCEKNPITAALAVSMGFEVVDKETILDKSDLLFCATGSKILSGDDWNKLKDGIYIASATSADDEFDLAPLKDTSKRSRIIQGDNVAYVDKQGKVVNLLMDGDSVNFVDKSVLGPSVLLPEGETVATAIYLRDVRPGSIDSTARVTQLPEHLKQDIAAVWMTHFGNVDMAHNLPAPIMTPPDRGKKYR